MPAEGLTIGPPGGPVPRYTRVRVAGRTAGPDEGVGDQDHEPRVDGRLVILIARALAPRVARRHEHAVRGAPNCRM